MPVFLQGTPTDPGVEIERQLIVWNHFTTSGRSLVGVAPSAQALLTNTKVSTAPKKQAQYGATKAQEWEMTPKPESRQADGILTPSIPWDIAVRNQRERILRAMATNCAEKTFVGTTIADIVGTAGISRATFYKHFTNKAECFHAAVEDFLAELQSAAEDAKESAGGSQSERIRSPIAALLVRLAAEPEHATLLLVEAPNVDPGIVRDYRRRAVDALEAELEMAESPNPVGADPELAFGRVKVLLADFIAAGEIENLPTLLPEIVYISLLPYVGQDKALEEAQLIP
jgi:AcrR family transcriptional regulator